IEPGDEVLVCVNGVFGERMSDIVERCGGLLIPVHAEMGQIIEPDVVARSLDNSNPKLVALVHAETSTGVLQPLGHISQMAQERNVLLLVDTVTSLGGFPVQVDAWGIDAVYSGTQKCMSCPPGLSPISFSEKAAGALDARTKKVQSWYLDLTMVRRYWGEDRFYHHTAPINMIYALHEALRIIHEEGLDARFERHRRNHEALVAGIEAMGLLMLVEKGHRLWMLNAVRVPEDVDELQVRQVLLNDYNIEIGAGLGDLKGRIWRIGLMGESSTRNNVLLVLSALEDAMGRQGHECDPGAGVEAAMKSYAVAE
ncbi:MAG: alanine--glyoxylate aminotransferase family protein, partial [Armatimonadota bacterium]